MVTFTPVFFSKAAATSVRPELEITPGLRTRISAAEAAGTIDNAKTATSQLRRIFSPLFYFAKQTLLSAAWQGGKQRTATPLRPEGQGERMASEVELKFEVPPAMLRALSHAAWLKRVALDRGKVKAGRDSQPISEVELELKDGEIADLARLATRVAGREAALELRSKAERGYALADGRLGDHVFASAITLSDDMTAADGFRAIGFACLHHLAANRAEVLKDDPEGIHQMRVGLRRLRAALSLSKPLIEGAEFEAIKKDLKWLTGELAPARDFDVFVAKAIAPMEEHPPAGLAALETDIKSRRDRGFVRDKLLEQTQRNRP